MNNTRLAIRAQFAACALFLGLWSVRIAEFKNLEGLGNSALGWLMMLSPISLTIVMPQIPKITRKFGVKNMIVIGALFFALSIFGFSLTPPIAIVAPCFILLGIGAAFSEIGLNAVAQKIDRDDQTIMLSAHGFWSLGFMVGAIIGGWLQQNQVSFITQQILAGVMIMPFVFVFLKPLPQPRSSSANQEHAFPSFAILPICLIPFAALFVEGSMGEWSSVFLSEERGASPLEIGLITGGFMGGMALIRLTGDYLRGYLSAKFMLISSILLTALGVAIFASAGQLIIIGMGAIIAGIGAGVIYPLTIVFANHGRAEEEASGVIASIATISFLAFLIAPPSMGFIADYYSLSWAFLLTIPLILMSLLWIAIANRA